MRRGSRFLAAAALGISTLGPAVAASSDDGFLAPPPPKAAWLVDWGAGLSPALVTELAGTGTQILATEASSFWLRMSLPASGQFYARINDTLVLVPSVGGASPTAFSHLWDAQAAYLHLPLREAGVDLFAGRRPYSIGSGLVLAGTGDGAELRWVSPLASIDVFAFHTGLLRPDFSTYAITQWDAANGARRLFAGGSLGVSQGNGNLSLMGLYQLDGGGDASQAYDSWYAGLMAGGVFLTGEYSTEFWYQGGRSPLGQGHTDIGAFAGRVSYTIYLEASGSPSLGILYAIGSGDADRSGAIGAAGNASGGDRGFQGFGSLTLGSALRPAMGNVQALQLSCSANPFESGPLWLRKTSLGLKYHAYWKVERSGVIGQGEATLPEAFVGQGLDLSLRWGPFTDLSCFASCGAFLPGSAYPAGEPLRWSLSSGLSLSL